MRVPIGVPLMTQLEAAQWRDPLKFSGLLEMQRSIWGAVGSCDGLIQRLKDEGYAETLHGAEARRRLQKSRKHLMRSMASLEKCLKNL